YIVVLTNNSISVIDAGNPSATTFVSIFGHGSTYSSSQIFQVQFSQSADTLFMTHPSVKPMKLLRTGVDSFQLWAFDDSIVSQQALRTYIQGAYYPYRNPNYDGNSTITPSGTSGPVTLTASNSIFNSGQIGS